MQQYSYKVNTNLQNLRLKNVQFLLKILFQKGILNKKCNFLAHIHFFLLCEIFLNIIGGTESVNMDNRNQYIINGISSCHRSKVFTNHNRQRLYFQSLAKVYNL